MTEATTAPTIISSSQNTSSLQIEQESEKETPVSRPSSIKDMPIEGVGEKVIETTPIQEAEALEKLSDEPDYPTGAKLGIIVASLCLSVFLMALVSLLQGLLF